VVDAELHVGTSGEVYGGLWAREENDADHYPTGFADGGPSMWWRDYSM